jgi:hypothetical protein
MDIRISTEGGLGWVAVSLDGIVVGEVERVNSYRSPKKWSARIRQADGSVMEISRATSATDGAFIVAQAALEARTKNAVLAKLDSKVEA